MLSILAPRLSETITTDGAAQISALTTQRNQLQADLGVAQQALADAIASNTASAATITALRGSITTLETAIAAADAEIAAAEAALTAARTRIAELESASGASILTAPRTSTLAPDQVPGFLTAFTPLPLLRDMLRARAAALRAAITKLQEG